MNDGSSMHSFRSQRRVEFRDTDAAGIAHFSVFFSFMEEVEHEYLRSLGLSVMMRDSSGVLSWPRVAAHCEYQGAVRFENVLDIELTVERVGEKSITYRFAFSHSGRQVAEGRLTAVCCRIEHGEPLAVPIPEEIAAKLRG
jgi:acyl-CoA thioester hydrolase